MPNWREYCILRGPDDDCYNEDNRGCWFPYKICLFPNNHFHTIKLITNGLLKLPNFASCTVNFIFWCKLFKTFFKTLRSNVELHGRKPSSIYVLNNHHEKSILVVQLKMNLLFLTTQQKLVHGGSNFMLIAVPIT